MLIVSSNANSKHVRNNKDDVSDDVNDDGDNDFNRRSNE